jgi:hypothetical protein
VSVAEGRAGVDMVGGREVGPCGRSAGAAATCAAGDPYGGMTRIRFGG